MNRKIIFVIILIICNADTRSEGLPFYFSPGVQIGRDSGGNTYFSYQFTLGMNVPIHRQDMIINGLFLPCITFGKRHYKYKKEKKYESFTYLDGQISILPFGLGRGKIWKSDGESFSKSKLWVYSFVPFTIISYDYISFADKPNHHFGAFGVLPIPLGGWAALN